MKKKNKNWKKLHQEVILHQEVTLTVQVFQKED